jgi:AraC-like DNA-binding protein
MFDESISASIKSQLGEDPATRAEDSCRFWTRLDGQVCVQHVKSLRSAVYRPHSHSEYGIVVCLEGEVSKAQLGSTTIIGPGEVVMSNSGIDHASGYLAGPKGYEAVCITVERRALAHLLGGFRLPLLTEDDGPIFTGKFASRVLHDSALDIVREINRRELGHEIVIEGLATRILVETLRAWPRTHVERGRLDLTPRLPRKDFVRAYEFMRWCKKDSFRLQHLCHFLGSSEERFTRLFLTAARATPAHFYNELLMERGRELLMDPQVAVKTISFELGFKTSSHFIVSFRRHFGMTPQDYRLQHADQIG